MNLGSLLKTLLQQAAREAPAQARLAEAPRPCRLGFVFALGIESGCFEDRLDGLVTIRSHRFTLREGGCRGQRIAVILAGPGCRNAAAATDVLIDGHRPERIVSAGLAGALQPALRRNDILVADRVINADREIALERPASLAENLGRPGVFEGPLLTVDHVVRSVDEKRALGERSGATAADMEAFYVADVCRRRGVPFSAVRVINDTANETLPTDVEHLLMQKTAAARAGAALGAVWRRPASVKDLYRLRENALVASLRLADFLISATF
jgi:adenosylhomocysteine nucleosidase